MYMRDVHVKEDVLCTGTMVMEMEEATLTAGDPMETAEGPMGMTEVLMAARDGMMHLRSRSR